MGHNHRAKDGRTVWHQRLCAALAFAPDGSTLATTGSDQTLRLWDWRTATELCRCQGVADQWQDLAFSPNGKLLASASVTRRSVQLWDAASGRALRTLGEGSGHMATMAFSPDGKTLAAAARTTRRSGYGT